MKTLASCVCCFMCLAAATSSVHAQDRPAVRISASVGLQEGPGKLAFERPLDFFGRSGSLAIDDDLVTMDVYDLNAVIGMWKNAGLGAGVYRTSTDRLNHPYTASIPSPQLGRLNTDVTSVTPQMVHAERAAYLLATWTTRVTDRFDMVFSGGPMFFELEQELPEATPVAAPNGAQALVITPAAHTKSTTGFHLGMDLDYVFARRAGGGILIRYSRGSVDLPNGTAAMTLGGLQIAAGFRLKL